MKRPNFLFLIADQQRAADLGCYGHRIVQTPHIDALAARGTRFERFYCASPICMPNRATLMTGFLETAGPNLAWLTPPILNPTTRLALVAEPAAGRLAAVGIEAEAPATGLLRLEEGAPVSDSSHSLQVAR